MIVTEANALDIPRLVELLGLLFTQEAEFEPDPDRQERGVRAILDHPSVGQILVLRDEDGIVEGMVNLLFTVSTALGGRVALLEDMIVEPEYRSAGNGSMLLNAAILAARAAGCLRVTLLTDRGNHAAEEFYLRHGFIRSTMMPMRLALETNFED
jgi:GNAT superfamily N-acetyltransferase